MRLIRFIMEKKTQLSDNTKNVINNSILSYMIRGGSLVLGLFTTPAYLKYFSNESVLGVWFTLLSILSWILYFDVGIGHGLRNKIAYTITKDDKYATKRYISSAYFFIAAVGILLILILTAVAGAVDWNDFLNISSSQLREDTLRKAVIIALFSIILQFVLKLVTSVLYAMQKSFMPGFLTLLTNLFLLIFVLICNASGLNNNIIRLSIAYLLAVNLPLIITTVYLFSKMLYYAKPSIKFFDLNYAMDTLKTGGMFLLIQLFKLAIYSTNLILITKLVSSSAVVEYNIYQKVFSLINSIFILGLTPVWSAVTRAAAENNYLWIKKVSNAMYAFGGLVTISQLLLYPVIQVLFDVWLGSETIKVNYSILIFYMIDEGIGIWSGIAGYVSNGLNQLKLQVITMGIGAMLKIPLSILGVKISGSYAGVILAHSLSLLPFCLLQTIWLYRHINGKLGKDAGFVKGAKLSGNRN